jgi:predicted component of type VI protein secretion system
MKGQIPKSLSKFLTKNVIDKEIEETIAIADKRLGKALTEELGLTCKQNDSIDELMRVIRFNIAGLLNRTSFFIQWSKKKTTA